MSQLSQEWNLGLPATESVDIVLDGLSFPTGNNGELLYDPEVDYIYLQYQSLSAGQSLLLPLFSPWSLHLFCFASYHPGPYLY